ncbi:MAG: RAD55 family ATPase [Halobacteriales archaeon]
MSAKYPGEGSKLKYKLGVPRIDKDIGGVKGGTNVLVTGDATTAKDEFLRRTVTTGVENDEGVVYVTTNDPAEKVLEEHEVVDHDRFAVVDCVSESQGVSDIETSETVRTTGSPSDMTGIGIQVSDILEEFWEVRGIKQNRVCLNSVSTLLMYSNLETVFRFLHVFTGRVRSVEGLGIFLIDPGMHDEKEFSTLQQLFNATVEFDDGRVRVDGLTDEPTDWTELE